MPEPTTTDAAAPSVPFPAFGAALWADARRAGFVSQRHLARMAGLAPDEVQRYVAGLRLPTIQRLAAMVAAGIDPAPLIAAVPIPTTKEPIRCPTPN